jgi:hypothetical protein
MKRTVALLATLVALSPALAAPVPEAPPVPVGAPPQLTVVSMPRKGQLVVQELVPVVREEARLKEVVVDGVKRVVAYKVAVTSRVPVQRSIEVRGLTATTADGKAVAEADLLRRLARPTVVAQSADGGPVAPAYLRALRPDTLVLRFERPVVAPEKFPVPLPK